MAYNQKQLDVYRQLIASGESFVSTTCPYCNGQRDPTVKHLHPSTKPADPWAFWRDVLIRKYATVQSTIARRNMAMTFAEDDAAPQDGHSVATPRMFIVGPMVDQSELPFRMLCRQYGATLAYTPMLHAKSFAEGAAYRRHFLTTTPPAEVKAAMEEARQQPSNTSSNAETTAATSETVNALEPAAVDTRLVDRPCIVQFCGHDADTVLAAARYAVLGERAGADDHSSGAEPVYPVHVRTQARTSTSAKASAGLLSEEEGGDHLLFGCDAVDLNLGCPQGIARRGHYGSFLMEDWELVHTLIHTLHVELEVPVTVKIRVFDHPGHADGDDAAATPLKDDFDEALTVLYARMIRDAGAQLLCVHGRTRDMKGQQTSEANMELIRRVRRALHGSIPVLSNGNVYTYDDVLRHLRETRCEGHMCAEPLLWDPALFSHPTHPVMPGRTHGADKATRLSALHTALVYLAWVRRCPVDVGFVKAHLFKMCFHSYELHTEFREVLGQLRTSTSAVRDVEEEGEEEEAKTTAADFPNSTTAADVSASAFAQHLDAMAAQLHRLIEAEWRCSVEGEQPKTAQVEKAKAKEASVDVWAEEDGLGIDF